MANFTAVFRLIAQNQGFQSTLQQAKGAIAGLGPKLGQGFKDQVGKIFSVKQAFTMLKGTMEEVLNRAKQYNNLGMRMGIPATEVQKLDKAAEAAGINVASLSRAMTLVQKFGGEAIGGTSKKTKVLVSTLGATKEQLKTMASGGTEAMATLADLMDKVGDSAERDYIGIKIMGEKWPEVKQMIEQGGGAIRNAGKDQTTWGASTQDSLTRIQKAWANMWNDISVSVADLMAILEPVVGILRMIGNVIMILVHGALWALGQGIDAISFALLTLWWLWEKVFGDDDDVKNVEKQMAAKAKAIEERNKKAAENVGKDISGMGKGLAQTVGAKTGEEIVIKKDDKKSTDTRSMEERQAYDEALEKQEESALKTALANAKEEEKLEILKKQLEYIRKQEEELKKKHPERYKETADYLELQEKIAEKQREIEKQARKDAQSSYKYRVQLSELSNERRLAKMKDAGATEEQIFAETVNQQKETAVRLAGELDALRRDEQATDEERAEKAIELAKAIGKTEDLIYEERKKAKDAENEGAKAEVSSLQKVGGGGAVAVVSTAAKQLMEAQETNRLLSELVTLSEKIAAGSVNAGTYGKP